MADHTLGPWLRAGLTVYAPMHAGWRKGAEQLKNRITTTVQYDRECSEAEAGACACLVEASPDLLDSNKAMVAALNGMCNIEPDMSDDLIIHHRLFVYGELPSEVVDAYFAARDSVRKATGGAA